MPGSVLPPVSVGVFPESLSTKFTVSRAWESRVVENHDGSTERASLVDVSRRTWKLSKRLFPSEAAALRDWFDAHQADAFYFYDLRETSPPFSYDPTGASTAGRYIVRFNSDWRQSIGMPRSDVDVELIELLGPSEIVVSATLNITSEYPAGNTISPIADVAANTLSWPFGGSTVLFDGSNFSKRTDSVPVSVGIGITGFFLMLTFWNSLNVSGAAQWLVYDVSVDVTYQSGATATLRPLSYRYIPGYYGGPGGVNSILNRGNIIDSDPATYATFNTGQTSSVHDPTQLVLTF
jgi:hypothetical protein